MNGYPQEHRDQLYDNAAFLDRSAWDASFAAKERSDPNHQEHPASAGPAHPWPSEIARARLQERTGGEVAKSAGQLHEADHGDGHSA